MLAFLLHKALGLEDSRTPTFWLLLHTQLLHPCFGISTVSLHTPDMGWLGVLEFPLGLVQVSAVRNVQPLYLPATGTALGFSGQ